YYTITLYMKLIYVVLVLVVIGLLSWLTTYKHQRFNDEKKQEERIKYTTDSLYRYKLDMIAVELEKQSKQIDRIHCALDNMDSIRKDVKVLHETVELQSKQFHYLMKELLK
ncbi:MAG: hypothetical protein ACRDCN_03485, partial [Tannerellaceae bacterium]